MRQVQLDESVDMRVDAILHAVGVPVPKQRVKYRAVKRRVRTLIHVLRAAVSDINRPRRKRRPGA